MKHLQRTKKWKNCSVKKSSFDYKLGHLFLFERVIFFSIFRFEYSQYLELFSKSLFSRFCGVKEKK
jgi:hypothetical protein